MSEKHLQQLQITSKVLIQVLKPFTQTIVSIQKCSHCTPTYHRAGEITERDFQGFGRDIMMSSGRAMWAFVTDL